MTKKSKFCRSCINLLPLLNSLKSLTLKINYLELSITRIVIHLKTSKIILEKNSILGLASVTLYCNKTVPGDVPTSILCLHQLWRLVFNQKHLFCFLLRFYFRLFSGSVICLKVDFKFDVWCRFCTQHSSNGVRYFQLADNSRAPQPTMKHSPIFAF